MTMKKTIKDDEKDYFYLMLPTLLVLEVFIFLY